MKFSTRYFTTKFNPKIYEIFAGYNRQRFVKDFGAGLTVSVVALPLAMAFAIASGLKPEAGIFTAIIAGFLISLFSGSRVQIGGPAGAFIVIVYGIVQKHGVDGLLLATFMSGIILWMMGFLRMGILIKFIPIAVIIGFTNGIAVLIAISQVKESLGLEIDGEVPAKFFPLIKTLYNALPSWKPEAVLLCLFALTIIVVWQKVLQRETKITTSVRVSQVKNNLALIPGSIVALIVATGVSFYLKLDVETIGSKFGGIPQGLPKISMPNYSLSSIEDLIFPAFTLAILGAVESLLCARVADSMIKDNHDSNQELLAQGFANMVMPFFAGMPATGTIARTVTNVKNGGTSPIAGIVHAIALLLIVLLAAPLAKYIPLAVLSAILLFVAWNMGDWHEFARLRYYRTPYKVTLLSVFILTVVMDLTVAVQVGILLACFIFIFRISDLSGAAEEKLPWLGDDSGIKFYRMSGALFFGAIKSIETMQENIAAKALILDFSGVIYIDSSGEEALRDLLDSYQEKRLPIYIFGLSQQPHDLLKRTGWLQKLGKENVFDSAEQMQQEVQKVISKL